MNQDLLDTLLSVDEPEQYPLLIEEHNLSLTTIQQLKDHSAQFRFSDPAETLRIAQIAYDLSLHMEQEAQALGQWTLGNALMHSGDFKRADQFFQKARNSFAAAKNGLDAARMGLGHVVVLGYIGETSRALELAKAIEPILDAASRDSRDDLERLGKLLMNLGNVYELTGQYEEALETYQRQVPIAEKLDNQLLLAQAKHNQAVALVQLNAFEDALVCYQEAREIFEAEDATSQLTMLLGNQTELYVAVGNYTAASVALQEAEHHLLSDEQDEWQVYNLAALRVLIDLATEKPISREQLDALHESKTAFSESGERDQEGDVWQLIGECHLQRLELQGADLAFEQAREIGRQTGNQMLLLSGLYGLAQSAQRQQQTEKAMDFYRIAIEHVESMRHALYVDTHRSGFLSDKLSIYYDLADLYLINGKLADAFAVVEQAKSRLIVEKLVARLATAPHLPHMENVRVKALSHELDRLLATLENKYTEAHFQLAPLTAPSRETASSDITMDILQVEAEAQDLIHQIQRETQIYSRLSLGELTSLDELGSLLNDTVFLQFHITHGNVCAFVVEGQEIQTHCKLAPLSDVEDARKAFYASVERYWELLSRIGIEKAERYLVQLIADSQKHLARLFDLLIRPIYEYIKPHRRLSIGLDGVLYYVPFHALFDGEQYVVQNQIVSYVPSATVLHHCSPIRSSPTHGQNSDDNVIMVNPQRALLLGCDSRSDLAYVADEIEGLSAKLVAADAPVDCYLGAEATTERFLATATDYSHIHIAAHAEFRADKPMLSSISLSDRRLTLAEISQLNLTAELIVLSGCETGQGRLYGADSLSLASGFLGAGARSLIVSLWRVEDMATAMLMGTLYESLLNTKEGPATALALAQQTVLKSSEPVLEGGLLYQHPACWAPFMLLGSGY